MNMVERVAAALYAEGRDNFDDQWPKNFGELSSFWKQAYSEKARAALEAMMEPSEEMKAAGHEAAISHVWTADPNTTVERTKEAICRLGYQAMIKAALEEGDTVTQEVG